MNFPPSRFGKGARELGQSLAFPDDLNCQSGLSLTSLGMLFLKFPMVIELVSTSTDKTG
ncbi:hypothetical protein PQG02_36025 (plasmid) [Nostoc sp. UHCC 0926]|nr:hypothetical protein PQG02_36025 [Nostoc sp. UHCC 0926]